MTLFHIYLNGILFDNNNKEIIFNKTIKKEKIKWNGKSNRY